MMALRHRIILLLSVALATFCLSATAGVRVLPSVAIAQQPETADTGSKQLYIVQLKESPALSSVSSIDDFNPQASHVQQHVYKLKARQDQLLLSVNAFNDDIYRYNYTFNGMAVMLTPRQAEILRKRKGVARVWRDRQRLVATNQSPQFLGLLDKATGLQAAHGLTGEDIIIGVIDSGITPDHPSFSDTKLIDTNLSDTKADKKMPGLCRSSWAENSWLGKFLCSKHKRKAKERAKAKAKANAKPIYDSPKNWRGECQTGPGFPSGSCNNKLIGARYYRAGFDLISDLDPGELSSPADVDGHGTHIATIAAGNKVSATVLDREAGDIRGMAPRARVAAYKACWLPPQATRASCSTADLVNAIEDAVADGVHIINFSIGDTDGSISDPDDLALLAATEAGVLTVVSAGNDGPDPETIQSPATNPWVISVGASSRPGTTIAEGMRINSPAGLGGLYESKEASFTPLLATTGIINANLVLVDDGVNDDIEIDRVSGGSIFDGCTEFTVINAEEVAGNVALIERGGCDFEDKIRNAQLAGAIAVVVYNNDYDLLTMAAASSAGITIPAVMIGQSDAQLIINKFAEDNVVNLTLDSNIRVNLVDNGNTLSRFSSRGPDFDFLKPDVIAPGKNILGGNTPQPANGKQGEEFQYLSGTSQSAPHVAGVAALIKQARQDWTPAQIKSALMTTSRQENIVLEEDGSDATALDMGAGLIVPNNTLNPGLLYDTEIEEYDAFLCANEQPRLSNTKCQALFDSKDDLNEAKYGLRAEDINLPSVYVRELVASRAVKRTVTNPGPLATFNAELVQPGGASVTVDPPISFTLDTGETQDITLTFSRNGAAATHDDAEQSKYFHLGSLTWVNAANNNQRIYSPLAVLPSTAELGAPDFIAGQDSAGSLPLPLEFAYDGQYIAFSMGLHLPCVLPDSTPDNDTCDYIEPDDFPTANVLNANFADYELLLELDEADAVKRFFIDVPAEDNRYFRVTTYDKYTDGNDDLDLYLYRCTTVFVENDIRTCEDPVAIGEGSGDEIGQSLSDQSSTESIAVENPEAGTYVLDVHGYSTDDITGGAGAQFTAFAWSFGDQTAGSNLLIPASPLPAVSGTEASISVNWAGLSSGLWLGGISHEDEGGPITGAITVIEIDNKFFTQD
jgi:subtilisin family serine protease